MKRILYILLLLLVATSANAQTRKLERRTYADQKRVHFGFSLGLNMQNLRLVPILNRKRDDLLNPAEYKYTAAIDRVSSKMVILTFYFE